MRSVFIVAGAAAAIFLASCNVLDSGFVKACEAALQDRLKSPSSYRRIDIRQGKEPADIDRLYQAEPSVLRFYKSMNKTAVTHFVLFTYEATNSFGAIIRQVAKCSYDSLEEQKPTDMKELVKIDGKTNIEHLADQIVRARR